MRLPSFEYLQPQNLDEGLSLLGRHSNQATVLAGGTDLLVRMKQGLIQPATVISLRNLEELRYIERRGQWLVIGAMTPLYLLRQSDLIRDHYHALWEAIGLIGAPPIQHFRGTIGGNLCLQSRCLYYNQSAFWRSGRTKCHKDMGKICYAEKNSDRCRSANQSDGACALMALGAKIILASTRGRKTLPIEDFFTGKGEQPFALEPDELVTEVRLPLTDHGQASSFKKLTYRSAIDFALVSSAIWLGVRGEEILAARIAVGGAGAAPLLLREASNILVGKSTYDTEAVEGAARQVRKHATAFMVNNLGATLDYRQKMSEVLTRRGLREALTRISSSR